MSTGQIQNMYNTEFYKAHRDDSLRSAEVVVPLILNVFPADSLVDIGCGVGTWLSVFHACGVNGIRGFDVNDLPPHNYFVDKICIETGCDFSSRDFLLNIKSDLCICLEVGEHLPDEAAGTLVENLVKVSPVIIFSAAFPGQSGLNHINEQPPWYWRDKFHAHGYTEIDFLRPFIWSDARVCWWYRQNITSFVHLDYLKENTTALELAGRYRQESDINRLTPVSEWILKMQFEQRDVLLRNNSREIEMISKKFKHLEKSLESMKSIIDYLKKSDMSSRQAVELGEIFFNCGQMDDAKIFFEKSLMIDPENSDALNNLGVLSFSNRNLISAKEYFMNALRLNPGDQSAKDNLVSVEQLLQTSKNHLP